MNYAAKGALLLEGLVPGTSATDGPQLLEVLQGLHVPRAEEFLPLTGRVDFVFSISASRHPEDHSRAYEQALRLARDQVPAVLLHGYLRLNNVLDAGTWGLVAIDPRACVGDAASNAVDFAYMGENLEERIQWLSLVVDGDRLAAWCRVYAAFYPEHPVGRLA